MSKVIIEKCNEDTIESSLNQIIKKLGGLEKFISAGDNVFIKPNMFLNEKPKTGRTTHPALVFSLVKILYNYGAKVIVGERNGNINKVFEENGYDNINKYADVVNLDETDFILKDPLADNYVINFPLPIPKVIDNADFIINMPGLRTHVLTKMSNALKNSMGFLPRKTTRLIHLAGLDEAIVDLNRLIKSDLIITDAIYSLQGSFPATAGKALNSNFIMGSTDPVSIDSVAADIIGYESTDIDTIVLASNAGLGEMNLENIKVIGEIDRKNFILPKSSEYGEKYDDLLNIYSNEACISCKRALINGIFAFYEENIIENPELLKEINIITGQSYNGEFKSELNLLYGNCAKKYDDNGIFEPGCPPLTGAVKGHLKKLYNELKK